MHKSHLSELNQDQVFICCAMLTYYMLQLTSLIK